MPITCSQSAIGNRRSATGPPAFTLIELLVSLSIMAVIFAALGSTIVLAARALDQEAGPAGGALAARRATDRMLAEISAATSFSERTATSVTFTVPDRDGDGLPDTIRYAWSGVAGDALTRQYNAGPAQPFADDVQRLNFTYLLRTMEPPPPKEVESPERLLVAHEDAPGGLFKEQAVQDKNGCGAYFKPVLPPNALRWKVTRIDYVARRTAVGVGTMNFQVAYATSTLRPGAEVLATTSVPTSSLPLLPSWQSLTFTALDKLDPARGLCFTARTAAASVQGIFQYEDGGTPMTPNTHWMLFNSAAGWSGPQDFADMRIRVYGTVTTPAP